MSTIKNNISKNYSITPFAIWYMIIIPILTNFIVVNIDNTKGIYLIESILFLVISLFRLIRNKKIYIEKDKVVIIILIGVLIINNFITYYTADNYYVIKYFTFYILHLSFLLFLLTDYRLFFSNNKYEESKYNIPILLFVIINIIGCILIFYDNQFFINLTQGEYINVIRYKRYGWYQYSGVFAWPNHLAYISLALYLLCMFIPINKIVKSSLIILIILSVNRSTIMISIILLIIEYKEYIKKKLRNKNLIMIILSITMIIGLIYVLINADKIIFIVESLVNEIFNKNKISHRNLMLKQSSMIFLSNILFGVGFRRIGEISLAYNLNDKYIINSFNLNNYNVTSDTYFTVFAEVGIIGVLILVFMLFKILSGNNRRIKLVSISIIFISYSLYNPFSFIITTYIYILIFSYYLRDSSKFYNERNNNG